MDHAEKMRADRKLYKEKVELFLGPKKHVFRGRNLIARIAEKTGLRQSDVFFGLIELTKERKFFWPPTGAWMDYDTGAPKNAYWYPQGDYNPEIATKMMYAIPGVCACYPFRLWMKKEGYEVL